MTRLYLGVIGLIIVPVLICGNNSLAAAADNLIPNPSVEGVGTTSQLPKDWQQGYQWGDLDSQYLYLNSGYQSNRSIKVTISRYISGDAKWYFTPQPVAANQAYRYSDAYQANTTSHIVVAVTKTDQTTSYISLKDAPPSTDWSLYSDSFTTPPGAAYLTVFHLLSAVGYLTTDAFSLTTSSQSFNRALVSLTFDDGWQSQYQNGLPLLNQFGDKATFYIVTSFVGQPTYMSLTQIKNLFQSGHEIASHTVHHYDLTTLSLQALTKELADSKAYLENRVGQPILDFAVPYGAYNAQTTTVAKKYYRSQRTSDVGINTKAGFDQFALKAHYLTPQITLTQFQSWLDEAKANQAWLILMYHQVDNSGYEYSVNPNAFKNQLQALQSSSLPVLTVNQALNELLPQL